MLLLPLAGGYTTLGMMLGAGADGALLSYCPTQLVPRIYAMTWCLSRPAALTDMVVGGAVCVHV
jgi:hypothetical protein